MAATRPISAGGLLAFALAATSAWAQCDAPASWFPHAKTPEPVPSDPAFAQSNVDPCRFHQWSWQNFLWLTQTVDGDLRFIKELYSNDNLFDLRELDKAHRTRLPDWGTLPKGPLTVRPRDAKPRTIRGAPQIGQAGDNGILVDQSGHAVYYAIHINQTYYDFVAGRGYYQPETLKKAPPVDQFPVGTLELKSAWRIVNKGEDTSGFYTTKARIEPFKPDDYGTRSPVIVDPERFGDKRRTVALVGLHIVGVVQGHPEFVWATFEHRRNAPLLPDGISLSSTTPVSTSGWTFYAANTPASGCNQPNNGQVTVVSEKEQTLKPITQVVRVVADGGGSDAARIAALNESVRKQLVAADSTDKAACYQLIGSLWIAGGALQPNSVPGSGGLQRGSVQLASTTMETFRQSVGNCFTCHDTRAYEDEGARPSDVIAFPPKDLNLSHALRRSYVLNRQYLNLKNKAPATPKK